MTGQLEQAPDGLDHALPARHSADYDALLEAGICAICEQAPVQEGDCMCAPCRASVEASSDIVTDPVELALKEHWHVCGISDLDKTLCRCGLSFTSGPGLHRRHVAQKVYEALGLEGPTPWVFGEESPMRQHPQLAEVGLAEAAQQYDGDPRG